MNKSSRRFTLVEVLTVIAIISILAGLVIVSVQTARQRGRETQAKNDIAALTGALKKLDADYNKMLDEDNKIGGKAVSVSSDVATINDDVYDAMIAELSAPKNSGIKNNISVNFRKRVYLEPQKGFDPKKDYDHADNKKFLWRDPWGKPYIVYIKVTRDSELEIPTTNKTIAGDLAVYSFGPNGKDDKGCNVDLEQCINGNPSDHKEHDDIASF